jgi:hypothetical protein
MNSSSQAAPVLPALDDGQQAAAAAVDEVPGRT